MGVVQAAKDLVGIVNTTCARILPTVVLVAPPAFAVASDMEVSAPVAAAYAICAGSALVSGYKDYCAFGEYVRQNGWTKEAFFQEFSRAARPWAEMHGALAAYHAAIEQCDEYYGF